MLPPQQTAIFGGQGHHIVRDLLHQDLLLRVAHVQRRAHVQHPGIDVAEHAVAQAVAVQQRAKLNDIIRQMLRRHAGVFGKRNRLRCAFCITEQAHGFFAHRIDTLNTGQIVTELPANHAAFTLRNKIIQTLAERRHLALNQFRVIASKLHDIETQHLFIRHVGNQLPHGVPDNVLPRQIQHCRVDGFYRQRLRLNHKRCITQRGVEGVIFDVHQATHLR